MSDPYLPHSGSDAYRMSHYDLRLDYHVVPNRLSGVAVLDVEPLIDAASVRLDLVGLTATKVLAGGKPVRFKQSPGQLMVRLPVRAGEPVRLEVRYSGNPEPRVGSWGDVGWEELDEGVLVAGQPNGAATWFPCNDHPRDKATYRITVLCESEYAVVANGELTGTRRKASRTEWTWECPQPMTTYLATVQIGPYRRGPLLPGAHTPSRVPLTLAASSSQWEATQKHLSVQHAMMNAFEERFGPYPFDHYEVVVTNEALEIPLESQPLSILGSNHVGASWDAERLVAHELAHQWFGNSVSLVAWSDVWLNEGFACYAEWLWAESKGRQSAATHARRHWEVLAGDVARHGAAVLTDPGPAHMFDDWVYKKGALTLHALRTHAGDAAFFALLRAWTERYRHSNASTADFVALASELGGSSIAEVVHPWLYEPTLPPFPGRVL